MEQFLHTIDKPLEEWFGNTTDDKFPSSGYKSRCDEVVRILCGILKDVRLSAMLQEHTKAGDNHEDLLFLNGHGVDHAKKIIKHVSDLLMKSKSKLTPYECYLLLIAIYSHDSGIIFGRNEHEKKCIKVLNDMGTVAGKDAPEKRVIAKIASAHSGYVDNTQVPADTISKLQENFDLFNQTIRKRFLASILRFADEIADDKERASQYVFEQDIIPEQGKIYHAYSLALHTVKLYKEEVRLKFELKEKDTQKKCIKKNEERYLIDEIYHRTLKMFKEMHYCMRFMRVGGIRLERISVLIEIFDNELQELEPKESIKYVLKEKGYPDHIGSIYALCPEDLVIEGNEKNGEWLKNILEKGKK